MFPLKGKANRSDLCWRDVGWDADGSSNGKRGSEMDGMGSNGFRRRVSESTRERAQRRGRSLEPRNHHLLLSARLRYPHPHHHVVD
jgi:hypothetical protein